MDPVHFMMVENTVRHGTDGLSFSFSDRKDLNGSKG